MKIKCHWCGEPLKNGANYSLECECGSCSISFNRKGIPTAYLFKLFEQGKDYCIYKSSYSKETCLAIANGKILFENKPWSLKNLIMVQTDLQFENGMPQVYRLFEKLKTYIVFS
jgi:hypothetical protein